MSQGTGILSRTGTLGRTVRLSLPRQYISDMMHFARQVPSVPVQRRMNLAPTLRARQQMQDPPSWVVIFCKAFAVTCMEFPELNRAYFSFPFARLFEYNSPIASIAMEKMLGDERAIAFLRLGELDWNRLETLDQSLQRARQEPIESFRSFRTAKALYWLPGIVRRAVWWIGLNVSPRIRARQFGTFGLSVYASLGAESLHPISPLTCTLNYGPMTDDGQVMVRLIYDHRVLDGATVARALAKLEEVLRTQIATELSQLHNQRRASAA